jgi:hypothetical protein
MKSLISYITEGKSVNPKQVIKKLEKLADKGKYQSTVFKKNLPQILKTIEDLNAYEEVDFILSQKFTWGLSPIEVVFNRTKYEFLYYSENNRYDGTKTVEYIIKRQGTQIAKSKSSTGRTTAIEAKSDAYMAAITSIFCKGPKYNV